MPRLRPAVAAVFVLVLTAGSFWGSAALRVIRKSGEWTKQRQQEGFDTVEQMLKKGEAGYWIENDVILHMGLEVTETWYPDEVKAPLTDHSPLGMANMARAWTPNWSSPTSKAILSSNFGRMKAARGLARASHHAGSSEITCRLGSCSELSARACEVVLRRRTSCPYQLLMA